jgi:hypothetical protein
MPNQNLKKTSHYYTLKNCTNYDIKKQSQKALFFYSNMYQKCRLFVKLCDFFTVCSLIAYIAFVLVFAKYRF